MKIFTDQEIQKHREQILEVLDDKKALNIVSLDLRKRSTIADFFIICSGNSSTHTKAIAQAVHDYAKDAEIISSLEGTQDGTWILFDMGFLVVHVMQETQRRFYNLEQLWGRDEIIETA